MAKKRDKKVETKQKKQNKKEKNVFFTAEVFGMTLSLFCVLGLFCLISGDTIFGNPGLIVQRFFLGVFGYFAFPVLIFLTYVGVKLLIGFKINAPKFKKFVRYFFAYVFLISLICQTALTEAGLASDYGNYLSLCYKKGISLSDSTIGGLFMGLLSYPMEKFLSAVGCYIVYGVLLASLTLALFRHVIANAVYNGREKKEKNIKDKQTKKTSENVQNTTPENGEEINNLDDFQVETPKKQVIFGGGQFELKSAKDRKNGTSNHLHVLFDENESSVSSSVENTSPVFESKSYRDSYDRDMERKTDFVRRPYETRGFSPVQHPMGQREENNQENMFSSFNDSMNIDISKPERDVYVINEGGREREGISSFERRRNSSDNSFGRSSSDNSFENNQRNNDNIFSERGRTYTGRGIFGSGFGSSSFERREEIPAENSENNFDFRNRNGSSFNENRFSNRNASNEMGDFERSRLRGESSLNNENRFGNMDGDFSCDNNDNQQLKRKPFTPFGSSSYDGNRRFGERDNRLRENQRTENSYTPDSSFERDVYSSENSQSVESDNIERNNNFNRENNLSSSEDSFSSLNDNEDKNIENSSFDNLESERSENQEKRLNPVERAKSLRESGKVSNFDDDFENEEEVNNSFAGSYFSAFEKSRKVKPAVSSDLSHKEEKKIENSSSSSSLKPTESKITFGGKSSGQMTLNDIPEENRLINPIDNMPKNYKYNFPPIDLLVDYKVDEQSERKNVDEQNKRKVTIVEILGNHNIPAEIVDVKYGPAITRFEISIPNTVSLKKVTEKYDDLNLWIAAKDKIRIVAPITGTTRIGIEVPNNKLSIVGLRGLIESSQFKKAKKSSLSFCLGRDIVGDPVILDLAKMPHLLVAGATGTGKSVFLNTLLVSLLYKYSPEDLRIILVDPKIVEFSIFKGIPNLMFNEVFTDNTKVCAMLEWAVKEMDDRYQKLNEVLVKNIDEYNVYMAEKHGKKMPKILIIIDEFADLMSSTGERKLMENKIGRLAAKARSAGIHLIMATQRPSADIMEGSIKTNFVSRIAFKMASATDAMVIMGDAGAEKLLGFGDVLYRTSTMPSSERAQGCFVDTPEIEKVCRYIKDHNDCYYDEFALEEINKSCEIEEPDNVSTGENENPNVLSKSNENMVKEAMRVAINNQSVSTSSLQRTLGLGYPRAGKIMDTLEKRGYVSKPFEKNKRSILMNAEQFEEIFGEPL